MATSTTPNYNFDLYSDGDAANLMDQYNSAITAIDSALKTVDDKTSGGVSSEILTFLNALGITSANATQLGTILHDIINKTGSETYTVTDLGNAKKTAAGYIIPGA